MFTEFKKFIARGNVIELAVGLIMATYFGAIVKSFVDDIILPPVGYFIAGVDFSKLKYTVGQRILEDGTIKEITINYGIFVNTILTFLIVAFAVFMVVKVYNRFLRKKKEEGTPAPAPPTNEEKLLMEIRDAIRNRNGV